MPTPTLTRSLPFVTAAAAAVLGVATVASHVLAQTGTQRATRTGTTSGYGNNTRNQQNTAPVQRQTVNIPTVDTKALEEAKKDDAAARADEKKALVAVSAAHGKLMKGFDTKPETVEANKKIVAAKQAYDAAAAPLLKALEGKPEYKAEQEAVVKADQDVTAVRANPEATAQQRMDAAKKALDARNEVSQARTRALAGNAEVAKAKSDLDEATAALNKLRADFETSIADDPDLAAAKKALDDAKARTKDADDKLASAQKDVQTQKQAHDTAVAEQRKLDREAAQQARQQKQQNTMTHSTARSR